MGIPDFKFPTPSKTTAKAFQLQADLVDRADGKDDVDESEVLDKGFAKDAFARGQTPTVKQLAEAAAGRGAAFESSGARQAGPTFIGHPPAKVGWEAISKALEIAEDGGGLTADRVTAAFTSLGFVRTPENEDKTGCLVFERDGRSIGVRLHQLGVIRVAEVAVEKGKGDNKGALEQLEGGDARTFVAGTLIAPKVWEEVVGEFMEVLAEARNALAQASVDPISADDRGAPALPVDFKAFKAFIKSGTDAVQQAEDAQEAAELAALQTQIKDRWVGLVTSGKAPKGLMLQFDGPDGAGKTSSSKYILKALMQANDELPADQRWTPSTEVFKAPTAEDKQWIEDGAGAGTGIAAWQWRHLMRGIPEQREVMIKDRFQPGDFVYVGEPTAERVQKMGAEFEAYERKITDEGVMSFKAILWADVEKQAKTFGKRMARGAFAEAILTELERRGPVTDDVRAALDDIANKVEGSDMVAMTTLEDTLVRYQAFAEAADGVTPFPVINATDRHAARLDLMRRFLAALDDWERSAS
jgi:polyphosphate kinase 2 (PPK2 family)